MRILAVGLLALVLAGVPSEGIASGRKLPNEGAFCLDREKDGTCLRVCGGGLKRCREIAKEICAAKPKRCREIAREMPEVNHARRFRFGRSAIAR